MSNQERFEAWRRQALEALDLPIQGEFDKDSGGVYEYAEVRLAWEAWQYSRLMALEDAASECDFVQDCCEDDGFWGASWCAERVRGLTDD